MSEKIESPTVREINDDDELTATGLVVDWSAEEETKAKRKYVNWDMSCDND